MDTKLQDDIGCSVGEDILTDGNIQSHFWCNHQTTTQAQQSACLTQLSQSTVVDSAVEIKLCFQAHTCAGLPDDSTRSVCSPVVDLLMKDFIVTKIDDTHVRMAKKAVDTQK